MKVRQKAKNTWSQKHPLLRGAKLGDLMVAVVNGRFLLLTML